MSFKLHVRSSPAAHKGSSFLLTPTMTAGEFPWQRTGSLDASERHYAERYRQMSAEADRTSEELAAFLPREMIRMRAYLEERIARIQSAISHLSKARPEPDAYQAAIREGKLYLLDRCEIHTAALLVEAVKCQEMANAASMSALQ